MNNRIGLVTLGKSPREDIVNVLKINFRKDVEIVELGALDHLSEDEIKCLEPTTELNVLVTRISDDKFVSVDKEKINELLQKRIREMEMKDVDCIILGCTGKFPKLSSILPFIKPEKIFREVATSVLQQGKVGIIMPSVGQKQRGIDKWSDNNRELFFNFCSPYESIQKLISCALDLQNKNVDVIILDCMGFSDSHFKAIKGVIKIPILYPADLIGKIASWIIN